MLNRKELFHRNLIEQNHPTSSQDASVSQNTDANAAHPYVAQSNLSGPSQLRGVANDNNIRDDAGLGAAGASVNLTVGTRTHSSNTNQRLSNNKDSNTVKRVQGKFIK